MSYDLANCIAMSEDGSWIAFPRALTRGQVMGILAENCMSWWDAIHYYRIRLGYVHVARFQPLGHGREWEECLATDLWAQEAWIARGVDTPTNPV